MRRGRHWTGSGPLSEREQRAAFRYTLRTDDTAGVLRSRRKRASNRRERRKRRQQKIRQREKSRLDTSMPWDIVYGVMEVGGVVSFVHTSGPASQKHKNLHMIVTLASHEIQCVEAVFFDEYELDWDRAIADRPLRTGTTWQSPRIGATGKFRGLVSMQINYGAADQQALSVPVGDDSDAFEPVSGKWTSDHRQRGHAHVYLRLAYDEKVFTQGVPDIVFRVRGMRKVTDPRTGLNVPGSTNPALILHDYITNPWFGMNIPASQIDVDSFKDAADICDELIELADGSFQKRYEINTHFGADQSPLSVLREMTEAMAGRLSYVEGKLRVLAGKGRQPVMEITEDMILGEVSITSKTPRDDAYNSVRGTFVSAERFYTEDDFTPVENAYYLAEDNGIRVEEDVTFNMTTNETAVRRLAKIMLESSRQGIAVDFTATMAAYEALPGEWVSLTLPRYGWESKVFEVARATLQISSDENGAAVFSVQLSLHETIGAIYDWNKGEETVGDPSPDTNLPDPYAVEPPTGLTLASGTEHLYLRSDGTVFARMRLAWTLAQDTFVINGGRYEIQYKQSLSGSWQPSSPVAGDSDSAYILDVQDGVYYDARVRAVNSVGSRSEWAEAYGHLVVGKTAPPSNVQGFACAIEDRSVRLEWRPVTDLDVREYEIRWGAISQSWADVPDSAVRLKATSFLLRNPSAGSIRFFLSAVDTSGNMSVTPAVADLIVLPPEPVANYTARQVDNNVLLDWSDPDPQSGLSVTTGRFPVDKYRVFKGAVFAEASFLGEVSGSFFPWIELSSGLYTYWVLAVDSAGNQSEARSQTLFVSNPPDYVLLDRRELKPADATLTLALDEGDQTSILMPVDPAQTWTQHFTDAGKTTIQGFIDAGYSSFLMPGSASLASAQWTYDLELVLAANIITVSFSRQAVEGSVPVSVRIAHRETPSSAWVEQVFAAPAPESCQSSASNFRYVRVTIEAQQGALPGLVRVRDVVSKIETKKATESGTGTFSVAADPLGKVVTFGQNFLDIMSINVTPSGTSLPRYAVVNFIDVPNPESFKVYLYDKNGNLVSGGFNWIAEGVISQ